MPHPRPASHPPLPEPCGHFSGDAPPMPMGCGHCGHPPYAHGCDDLVDHAYEQPTAQQMAERLDARRQLGLGRVLPPFEPAREAPTRPAPVVPAPRQPEPASEPSPPRVRPVEFRPAVRADGRRPMMPGRTRPHLPVETREDRAARLTLAREPLVRRRARIMATTQKRTPPRVGIGTEADIGSSVHRGGPQPWNAGRETGRLSPGELAVRRTITRPPDIPGSSRWRQPYRDLSEVAA